MREYNKRSTPREKRKAYTQRPEIKEKHRIEARDALKNPIKRDIINKRQRERNKGQLAQQARKEYYDKPEIKERERTRKRINRVDPTKRKQVLEQDARHSNKRRGLGYTPMNDYFKGSHRHHLQVDEYGNIDKNKVLRIPIKEHESIHHDRSTGKGMVEINEFCLSWYINTYQKDKPYNYEVENNILKLQKIVEYTKEEVKNRWRNRYESIEVVQ
jgi:hypothetical protein